eukprot:14511072-Heterocapsa_arctica.AAC.1
MRSGATDDVLATVLVGMLKEKGYGFACVTNAKGCGDKQALAAISRWLEEAGLTSTLRLRTDSEVSICAVAAR